MDTIYIFIVLGLFIILTVSLRIVPRDSFGVLEQFEKIHRVYTEPGIHFVLPFVQKMYIYSYLTTVDFNSVLIAPAHKAGFYLTMTISVKINDIKKYHTLIKPMVLHDELLIVMAKFLDDTPYSVTLSNDLSQYLSKYLSSPDYPFTTTHIQIIDLKIA